MNKLKEIKEKIRITNPEVTDGTLDLLYKYVIQRLNAELNNLNLVNYNE